MSTLLKTGIEWGTSQRFNPYNKVSQDQMIGLFLGFAHIVKLVDNVYVKPTPSDVGFYILDEVKAITDRMM